MQRPTVGPVGKAGPLWESSPSTPTPNQLQMTAPMSQSLSPRKARVAPTVLSSSHPSHPTPPCICNEQELTVPPPRRSTARTLWAQGFPCFSAFMSRVSHTAWHGGETPQCRFSSLELSSASTALRRLTALDTTLFLQYHLAIKLISLSIIMPV